MYMLDMAKAYHHVDWSYLEKCSCEAGLSSKMGTVGHGVCYHCMLCGVLQWCHARQLPTYMTATLIR